MEEKKKVTDAEIVKDTPNNTPEKPTNEATKTDTTPEAAPAAATTSTQTTDDNSDSLPWVPFVAGILVAILGWQLYTAFFQADHHDDDVVATVGSLTITETELTQSRTQAEALANQQGVDVSSPEAAAILEEQALEALINTKLLINAAEAAGFTVSDEEVETQVDTIAAQFGGIDGLLAQADSLGLDPKDLRDDIREQLIVDEYLRSTIGIEDISASEEEIQTIYDELIATGQEMPPLEEVAAGIEAQVVAQKQQDAVAAHIETLREDTTVEIVTE